MHRFLLLLPLCSCATTTKHLAFDPVDRVTVIDGLVSDVSAAAWVDEFVAEHDRAPVIVLTEIDNRTSEKVDGAAIALELEAALRSELGNRAAWQLSKTGPCEIGCDVAAVLRLASILDETCLASFSDAEEGDAPPEHGVIARSVFSQGAFELTDDDGVQLTVAIGEAQNYSEREAPPPRPGVRHACSDQAAATLPK